MEINVRKLAEQEKIKSPDLLTRVIGRTLFSRLLKHIEISGNDEVIVLDFTDIKVMDSSFIDEFIVKFIAASGTSEKQYFVRLRNISEIGQNNIESVFKSYLQFNKQRFVVVTENLCVNNRFFLGVLSPLEEDVLNCIRINKSIFSEDIASSMNSTIKMVDGVLVEMIKLRIIRQSNSGQFLPV